MKVEQPSLGVTAPDAPAATGAVDPSQSASKSAGPTASDTVKLSGDLRLADAAVKAISLPTGVRPEAVARGRALLESGQLGTDVYGLADRMLDAMTDPHDPDNTP